MADLTSEKFWSHRWVTRRTRQRRPWMRGERAWRAFLTEVLGDLPASSRILEVGCAPGQMVRRLVAVRQDLVIDGVDISEVGLERTRQVYQTHGVRGELFLQDVRHLPAGSYDAVCSFGLIEHFDDPGEIIAAHAAQVRPGGKVIVTVPNFGAPIVRWALERFSRETTRTHNLGLMHPDEIARRLEAAGLAEVATGAFGGCVLPRGALDATVGGCIYGGVCSIWNGGLLLADPVVRVSRWSPWQALIWATGVGRPDG